jgi:hypothetical protein
LIGAILIAKACGYGKKKQYQRRFKADSDNREPGRSSVRLKLKKQALQFVGKISCEEFEKQKNGFTMHKVEELTQSELFRES